ncbi:acyltransferase family protein [Alteromonas sp. 009811495]|uniref:acyltransferase family protein n=1 Tax=Alteromonas sp. 009811495 TaxID=3002962 RepID=UPI00237D9AD1|nr:acyltransferase family protein [Alteromonas sp. 009811495]WDT85024.1 acyltransferase family protein [Alteromonas sp. 009811495]
MSKTTYHPHIDALRAFAVLAVIIFHVNHNYLEGGFVGVDIFFVISGYLITAQILKAVSEDRFSFQDFYSRRIKRILPAALSVIGCTVLITQFIYLPDDAVDVASSAIWSSLSLPNVYFWKFDDTSYFASSSYTVPLLHYWSLGVEEQFYFVWPLVIVLFYRRLSASAFMLMLVLTVLLSAGIAEWLIASRHSFVYYMLPTRAGELLVGGGLAALLHYGFLEKPKKASWVFPVSCIALLISVLFIHKEHTFPGFLYLLPTLAAAGFIWSGFNNNSHLAKLLSNQVLLWVGKISFSAYLVHWPLLAFFRYGYGEPSLLIQLVLFFLIFVLAHLNWRFVEEKFRHKSLPFRQLLLRQAVAPIFFVSLISASVICSDGFGVRYFSEQYKSQLVENQNNAKAPNSYKHVCQYWRLEQGHLADDNCVLGKGNTPKVLLWGDSNAAQYIGVLESIANKQKWSFRNISHAACPPIFSGVEKFVTAKRLSDCLSSIELVRSTLEQYDTIIISSAFHYYIEKNDDYFIHFFEALTTLSETHKIVVLGNVPVFDNFDRNCLAKAITYPWLKCDYVADTKKIEEINKTLSRFTESSPKIHFASLNSWLCKEECTPYKAGRLIYYDGSHLDAIVTRDSDVMSDFEVTIKRGVQFE